MIWRKSLKASIDLRDPASMRRPPPPDPHFWRGVRNGLIFTIIVVLVLWWWLA